MSNQEAPAGTITIAHMRAAGYRTEYVNGMFSAGPLNDGTYRVTLFRDVFDVVHEVLQADPSNPRQALGGANHKVEVPLVREDVVTLIMNRDAMIALGKDLIRQAGGQIEEVTDEASQSRPGA